MLGICTLFLLGCEVDIPEQQNQPPENVIPKQVEESPSNNQQVPERKTVYADIDLEAKTIIYQGKTFTPEIVDTPETRRKGLMNRESLENNTGMLFVFEHEAVYPFWMKNTLIPLTMVWIAEDGKIIDQQDAVPCKQADCPNYVPAGKAKYVLEVNMGELEWPF